MIFDVEAARERARHIIEGDWLLVPDAHREHVEDCPGCIVDAACDEIERLRAENLVHARTISAQAKRTQEDLRISEVIRAVLTRLKEQA
jgi:hypothetical protein